MRIDRKRINDFVSFNATHFVQVPLWGGDTDSAERVNDIVVEVLTFKRGQKRPFQTIAGAVEIFFCLEGTATVSVFPDRGLKLDNEQICEGDTFLVPPDAISQIENAAYEGLVLLRLQAPGNAPSKAASPSASKTNGKVTVAASSPLEEDVLRLKKRIRDYEHYQSPPLDFVRERIWGKDGAPTDSAKQFIHVNLYSIAPTQENPIHYHPNAYELILCLQGRGNVIVRPRNDEDNGWIPTEDLDFESGDTILVPKSALHRYVNIGGEGLLLLAMQTPAPIIHLWPDEANDPVPVQAEG